MIKENHQVASYVAYSTESSYHLISPLRSKGSHWFNLRPGPSLHDIKVKVQLSIIRILISTHSDTHEFKACPAVNSVLKG